MITFSYTGPGPVDHRSRTAFTSTWNGCCILSVTPLSTQILTQPLGCYPQPGFGKANIVNPGWTRFLSFRNCFLQKFIRVTLTLWHDTPPFWYLDTVPCVLDTKVRKNLGEHRSGFQHRLQKRLPSFWLYHKKWSWFLRTKFLLYDFITQEFD